MFKLRMIYFLCLCVLPFMKQDNVLDVPENDLFLVEDVDGHMVARFQIIQLVGDEHLHLFYKLLFSINQSLDQLTKDIK